MAETPAVKDERKEMIDRARQLPEPPGGFNLRPRNFDEAFRFANFISKSSLIPAAFRGKPEDVMIAVQLAMELGVSPMQGLQNIAVINGRPCIWGDLLPAIVLQSGQLEMINEEDDGNEAKCTVKRKGFAPIMRTFSMEDAATAGLKDKQGPWQTYPKRMRQMRARAFALRDMFADLLKGVGVREEIEDYETVATDVTPPQDRIEAPQRRSEQPETTDEPTRSTATETEVQKAGEAHQEKTEPGQTQGTAQDSGGQPEKEPVEKPMIEQMRDWLKTAPIQQVMGQKSFISTHLGSLSQDDQMQICKEWNARKKEIRDAEEAKHG